MSNRPGRKRVSVDVPIHLWIAAKESADRRNITMTRWLIRAIYGRLKQELR